MTFHISEKSTKTHRLLEKLVRGRKVPGYILILLDDEAKPHAITNIPPDVVAVILDFIREANAEGAATVQ